MKLALGFLDPKLALDQAREADKRWKDKTAGKLNGLPIGIKDIIDTKICLQKMDLTYVKQKTI